MARGDRPGDFDLALTRIWKDNLCLPLEDVALSTKGQTQLPSKRNLQKWREVSTCSRPVKPNFPIWEQAHGNRNTKREPLEPKICGHRWDRSIVYKNSECVCACACMHVYMHMCVCIHTKERHWNKRQLWCLGVWQGKYGSHSFTQPQACEGSERELDDSSALAQF